MTRQRTGMTVPSPATPDTAPVPVTILTGFLGSGKTTVLNHVLQAPDMADTAVIINEFGEIPIDHLLVEQAIENTVVLQNGCICCTVRGDLVDTLLDLVRRSRQGLLPPFSRVAIETTGLADPTPIIQTLANDRMIAPLFTLHRVVATLDAFNGLSTLEDYPEAVQQLTAADCILITKSDLTDANGVTAIRTALQRINPTAQSHLVIQGAITTDLIFGSPDAHSHQPHGDINRWLGDAAVHSGHGHHHNHGHDHDHAHNDPNRHNAHVRAFCMRTAQPIPAKALERWLNSLLSLRSKDLLRIKGIVHVAGRPGPVIIQAVQHLLHPPTSLANWPDDDHDTRIVFITRDIAPAAIEASLDLLRQAPS